jgi:hypothetical protein
MDFQNGIKYPIGVFDLSIAEMNIRCSFYVNVGQFYCVKLVYTGADSHIILTSLEEYHNRQHP